MPKRKTIFSNENAAAETNGTTNSKANARNITASGKNGLPDSMPILLLKNEPIASPVIAPSAKAIPPLNINAGVLNKGMGRYRDSTPAMTVPARTAERNPLIVLVSPNIGFPSKKFFPKSSLIPPPKSTGAAFAT